MSVFAELDGPSRTIVVEPLHTQTPAPVEPEREKVPVEPEKVPA